MSCNCLSIVCQKLEQGVKFNPKSRSVLCPKCRILAPNALMLYLTIYRMKRPVCETCSGEVLFRGLRLGFSKRCKKCYSAWVSSYMRDVFQGKYPAKLATLKAKKVQTSLERYGVENPGQAMAVRTKMKQTCLEKWGVGNPFESSVIQEKIKRTTLRNFGVENPFASPLIQAKIRNGYIQRHGVENAMQVPEIRKRCQESRENRAPEAIREERNRTDATNLSRYGFKNAGQNTEVKAKIRATNMLRYGAPSLWCSSARGRNKMFKFYSYVWPSGREIKVQGYEPRFLDFLLNSGVKEQDILIEPTKFEYTHPSGNRRTYIPDVLVASQDIFYEVKSNFTFSRYFDENIAKAKAVQAAGKQIRFAILARRGEPKILTIDEAVTQREQVPKH